jgi:S1-C subfamily serine protease
LWASVGRTAGSQGESFVGIPADVIADMVNPLKEGRQVEYKTLGLRLEYLSLSQLRKMGR